MKKLLGIIKNNYIYIILLALVALSTIFVLENIQNAKSSMVFEGEKLNTPLVDSKIGYKDIVGKEFICSPPIDSHYLKLDLSKNDTYRVEFLDDNDLIDYILVDTSIENENDNCSLLYLVPEHIIEKGYTSIRIYAIAGDEDYHVYFLDITQDIELAEGVDYFVDFEIKKIELEIAQEDYEKIARDRQEAIELSILISDGIYVPASAYVSGEKFDTEIRLKGDWTDHLEGDKWSFRIKVDDDCIWGMSEFSIQDPDSRDGVGEYLIQEFYRDAGGVALRYNFVDVVINGKYMGVYAVEEGFTKRAVENSLKREGVIIKPNEDQMWESWAYYEETSKYSEEIAEYKPFSMNKTLNDEKLKNYASYAINNLNSYFSGNVNFSEIFDVEMFGKYYAILDLLKSHHGTEWHNMRYYYNPVTSLMEPITFDELFLYSSNSDVLYNYHFNVRDMFRNDEELSQAYFEYLFYYAKEFEYFVERHQSEILELEYILSRDGYEETSLDEIYDNVDYILDLKNDQGVDVTYTTEGNEVVINYYNNNPFPITKENVYINDNLVEFSEKGIYEGDIDNIRVEYTLPNIPDEVFSATSKQEFSFYVAGHAYGSPYDGNDGIHTPFLNYLEEISNNESIEFGVLTGDTVYEATQESFEQLKTEMSITDKPYYITAGNHCLRGGEDLFETNFGDLNYYFEKRDNLFIFLVPGENWSFSEEQISMVRTSLQKQGYDNIFVFMHQLAWVEEDNIFSACGLPNSWEGKSDSSNFWSDLIVSFDWVESQVYFIAGDVGALDNTNLIYDNIEKYHFIASGMGNGIMDNILVVNLDEYNTVSFDIKVFDGEDIIDGGNIENYKTLEVNTIYEIE